MKRNFHTDPLDASMNGLLKLGGAAALIAALIFRRWLGAEYMLFRGIGIIRVGPTTEPTSAIEWFNLLQSHRLVGLTLLNAFDLVNYALVGLIFLGLYAALHQTHKSAMTLATVCGFLGIAVYFASNQAFAILALSNQYAAATDAQRSLFLAAGEGLLTQNNFIHGGSGTVISFFLVNMAGLIIAIVMLRGNIFSKWTVYMGILANAFGVATVIPLFFAPQLVVIPVSTSAPFLLVWYVLLGLRLIRLGRA